MEPVFAALGIEADELFADIPAAVRTGVPAIEGVRSELDLQRLIQKLAGANRLPRYCFLGAGAYPHFIPAAVTSLAMRAEFLTAYTAYQPEVSQGLLQVMFEFQTLIAELAGTEIANASLYDHASALGEAARMTARISKGKVFYHTPALSRPRRETLANYLRGSDLVAEPLRLDGTTGAAIPPKGLEDACGVYIERPNRFGVLEDTQLFREAIGQVPLVVGSDPLLMVIEDPPGALGADIVIGSGQPLGLPVGFGGPHYGFMATRREWVRSMPGRIVAETLDSRGDRAYCLTLQTREQHIRRHRATSNICTNQTHATLVSVIHAAVMGKQGLEWAALTSLKNATYLRHQLQDRDLGTLPYTGSVFHEFTFIPNGGLERAARWAERDVVIGHPLAMDGLGDHGAHLTSVTEMMATDQIDAALAIMEEVR